MIANKSFPECVNSFYRDWITQLYNQGKVQQAVRTLQGIIDNPQQPPIPTLL